MANQTKWAIDPGHSEIQFKVKHLAISNVTGTFKAFQGEIKSENEDFSGAAVRVTIDVNSIDTNNTQRDQHLKGAEFFDAQQYPTIKFEGIIEKAAADYTLVGDATIHGITRPLTLDVDFTGTGKGRFGDKRAGFELSGKLNRKDFGLTWNMPTEAGGLIVGEEIKLHFDIQVIGQDR